MKHVFFLFAFFAVLVCTSCDAYRWPPYNKKLNELFRDNTKVMLAIEQEMIADGRTTVGSELAKKHQRLRHGEPELTPEQLDKYSRLFNELGFYGTFFRSEDAMQVRLVSQNRWSRDYYVSFIRVTEQIELDTCATVDRSPVCGGCYEYLDEDWILYYRWYPEVNLESPTQCANGR